MYEVAEVELNLGKFTKAKDLHSRWAYRTWLTENGFTIVHRCLSIESIVCLVVYLKQCSLRMSKAMIGNVCIYLRTCVWCTCIGDQ